MSFLHGGNFSNMTIIAKNHNREKYENVLVYIIWNIHLNMVFLVFCLFSYILQGFQNNKGVALEASFSPDSRFAFCGKILLMIKEYWKSCRSPLWHSGNGHCCWYRLILWMALFSWVPIFVDLTKMTHSWGSKFVASCFSFIIHTGNR